MDNNENNEIMPTMLGATKSDLALWYHNILFLADIVDIRYNIKGMNVWKPYGYSTIMNIKKFWDKMFQDDGIQELYFPQIVPVSYCEMNPEWWEGFRNEGFKVIAGENNEIQGALRPTGEAAMYPMYAMWIRNYSDLPFRGYETVSSFRYETKHTRPLIRDREITVWHEVHTVHATKEDSLDEASKHVEFYKRLWNHVAMAPLIVEKPEWEVFPGAVGGIEFYNIVSDGKAMENGSVNILGQAYAKKFNIMYKDKEGNSHYAWQVCTGNGARLLAGVFLQHGDDKGLIMPPTIAPIQVVIVPIIFGESKDAVLTKALHLKGLLASNGIRVHLDDKDEIPGRKFYNWEIKGVPLRVEIGPRDLQNSQVVAVKRNSGKKVVVKDADVLSHITALLDEVQAELLHKSISDLHSKIAWAKTFEEAERLIEEGKCIKIHWCKSGECYDKVKTLKEGVEIFGSEYYEKSESKCLICGKKTDNIAYAAKTY